MAQSQSRQQDAVSQDSPSLHSFSSDSIRSNHSASPSTQINWDFWAIRGALAGVTIALCHSLSPFGFHGLAAAASLGFFITMVVLLAELRLRHAEISGLVGGAIGAVLGLLAALLVTLVISRTSQPDSSKSFLEFISLLSLGYLGLVLGSRKGPDFRHLPLAKAIEAPVPFTTLKLLDTSVLIDGRIADICETHFLDGTLGVPRFVLHELQLVADSSDSLKRQRGRRGLEVLQRMQKMTGLEIRILEEDSANGSGVDQKLVDLARRTASKIVTNDYNLNKVARVQGIPVLNVNELANALKPAVLPGESMRVLILREGKESTQGVAYLNDGTMVVVDGARRLINRTVEILVTSVHQTPAGKMIFGRLDDRPDSGSHRAIVASPMETAPSGNGDSNGHARPENSARYEHGSRSVYPESESF